MNREYAKKILPVLQAFANGEEIQVKVKEEFCESWITKEDLLCTLPIDRYRIAPKKKEGWINIYPCGVVSPVINGSEFDANGRAQRDIRTRIACVKIEWEE